MNLLEVGAILKRERERCGITIRDVMDATKISRRNLTALEEGQVSALPHPVYLKGYVRNIAKMVGLDADELAHIVDQQYDSDLAKYLPQVVAAPASSEATAQSSSSSAGAVDPAAPLGAAPAAHPAPQPAPEPERETRTRFTPEQLNPPKRKKPRSLGSILVLVLLVAALVALLVQYQRMYTAPPPAPVAEPAPAVPNATAADNASETLDNATANASLTDEAAAPSVPTVPAAPTAPAAPEAPRAVPAPVAQSVPATSIEVSRKPAPVPASPAMQAPTPGMQQLTIAAKTDEVCWVQISDGQQVKSFTLRNGETHQVEFAKRLRVRLGNAGGVSFRLNGHDYPYEGKRGNIDTVEFGER